MLEKALKASPKLETELRLQQILKKMDRLTLPAESLRFLQAIDVLEYIGTKQARPLLRTLAHDAGGATEINVPKTTLEQLVVIGDS